MKPDIIIKSFNRPFYLHRCLESINLNVQNYGNIYILDDGTPQKYLVYIKKLYPNIIIHCSEKANEKSVKIENSEKISGYEIPSNLWINMVKTCSKYFLMIEDDVWFTKHIDLSEISIEMESNHIHLTKLGWQGNTKFLYNFKEIILSKNLVAQYPTNLFLSNEQIMKLLLENKYYIFSLFCRLGITNNRTVKEYYNLLSIPMGMYRKDFWLYTWKDSKGRAKELDLIKNAVTWAFKNRKNKNLIARLTSEVLKTTYISSAVGDYRKHTANFDMLAFNKILNEIWYSGDLDPMENYPNDFNQTYLSSFIKKSNNPMLRVTSYNNWCNEFKNQFRESGAQVD